jgi:competence protein ComEC
MALWLGLEAWLTPLVPGRVTVRIDTLAVGDGTCQLVRSGGEAMLWDCGSLTPGVGRMLVPRAVRALGVWRVPTIVITHPNLDHFNGVLDVAEPLGVEEVLVGEEFARHAAAHPRSPEAFMLAELARVRVKVRVVAAGESLALGGARVEFISPPKGAAYARDNDMSLVAKVGGPGEYALLCGDIQDQAIAALREREGLRPVVMEAPHHGSARDAAIAFVGAISPRVVLQSTGARRADDARWEAVRAGRAWWCTAHDGACWAEILRDGGVRSGAFRP